MNNNALLQTEPGTAEYTGAVNGPIRLDFQGYLARIQVTESRGSEASVRVIARTRNDETYAHVRKFELSAHRNVWTLREPEPPVIVMGGSDGVVISGGSFGGTVVQVGRGMIMTSHFGGGGSGAVTGAQIEVDVAIGVPSGSIVDISTHNGHVDIDVPTSSLRIDTHNGHVQVNATADRADLSTHNGPIQIGTVRDLQASTHNSSITATAVQERVEASSHNGSIELRAAQGCAPRASAVTHNADIRTYGMGSLSSRTHNGRVYER